MAQNSLKLCPTLNVSAAGQYKIKFILHLHEVIEQTTYRPMTDVNGQKLYTTTRRKHELVNNAEEKVEKCLLCTLVYFNKDKEK